jgi:hypothetical protein
LHVPSTASAMHTGECASTLGVRSTPGTPVMPAPLRGVYLADTEQPTSANIRVYLADTAPSMRSAEDSGSPSLSRNHDHAPEPGLVVHLDEGQR